MGCCCSSSDRVEPANTSQIPLKGYKDSDPNSSSFEGPSKSRSCTDVIFFILLLVFLGGLVYFLAYCYSNGDIDRVWNGYDSCGNVCGKKNIRPPNVTCFGLDHTDKKYLQINGIDVITLDQRNINRECVSKCTDQFKELLNRCIPRTTANTKTHFTKTAIPDYLQEVTEDLDLCKREILYLFLISFGFSILLIIFFRFLAGIVVWVILIGAMITSVAGTIFLWILWKRKKDELQTRKYDVETQEESVTSYLAFAIAATIATVIIWLVILVMRKRIKLVVQLFKEAGKAISSMPLILFEPILTFLTIGGLIAAWLYCSLWIESAGFLIAGGSGRDTKYYYKKDIIIKVARWYNLFALFWLIQFCVGCQHMVIAGAVSKWFFTRDRKSLGCPIARGFWNLIRYHLGSVALGSFLIALVQIVRAILKYIESKTKAGENAVSRCIFRTCQCCLWCFEKILQFFSRNAYIEVAMNGYSFCKGGQQAFKLFASNALRVAAINSVGDFVLFLGKAIVVIATVLIGVEMLHDKEELQHKWIPLALVGLFAYIVSHIFVTVYEMAIDTIFLCFCEDCEQNDGLSRPYYMSRGLMEFVQNSKRALSIHDNPRSEAWSTSSHNQK